MEKEIPSWKAAIVSSLVERDIVEKSFFNDLIAQLLQLKAENSRLSRDLTSCQQEKSNLQLEFEKMYTLLGLAYSFRKSVKSYDYEQKVFHLQEEVTELHRQKGSDANEGEVNSVRFTPSGHIFGSAGFDRKVRLWTYLNGKCEIHSTLLGCNAAVTAIDFDPNVS
ncbi:unnamed protein product [Trichobilharzia regenti]|nr:unnamed protein product [Trichobilharzia regenti]